MKPLAILLSLWLAFPVLGQTPTPPAPVKPVVVFPTDPAPPTPAPSSVINLQQDVTYVIHSNVPCMVLASPQGVLGVASETGPMKFMLKSWPGTAKCLNLTDKFIYFVTVQGTGTAELIVVPSGATNQKDITRKTFVTGAIPDPTPDPKPPTPPEPTPPAPTPAPIPADGFRSLIVYESADLSKLPATQVSALYSAKVRDYLTAHCAMGPDGKTKEWRCLDKDTPMQNESQLWQNAMKRPRTELPWIILSNGKTGYEGPLPKTEADLLTLLQKYGG